MPAYLIIRIHAESPELLKDYQTAAPPVIEKYNGRFLARGGEVVTLEGPVESRQQCSLFGARPSDAQEPS